MNKRFFRIVAACLTLGAIPVRLMADDQFDLCGPDLCLSGEGAVDESAYERRKIDVAVQFARANAEWMQFALTSAEIAFRNGDNVEFGRWTSVASQFLLFLDANAKEIGSSPFVRNRLRFEYSLARMINGDSSKGILVMPQDVKRLLPRATNRVFLGDAHVRRQDEFRSLLIVGAALTAYRNARGRFPQSLQDLVKDSASDLTEEELYLDGELIRYTHDANFWKLRIGGGSHKDEPLLDFMPAIDYVAGLKCPEIWFASTYSQRRKELFEKGRVNSSDVRCSSYLKNGVIHRGRRD